MAEIFVPEVVQVVPGKGHVIYAYFNDGSIHRYDAAPLLSRSGIFEKLRDPEFFHHALTVMNGTVAWDLTGKRDPRKCLDLDPMVIYQAERVEDPLDDHKKIAS